MHVLPAQTPGPGTIHRHPYRLVQFGGDGLATIPAIPLGGARHRGNRRDGRPRPEGSDDTIATIAAMADEEGDQKLTYDEYAQFIR